MTSKDLLKLKEAMPLGYRDQLAAKFEVTPTTIDRVLRGVGNRPEIIAAAIEIAETHKQYLAELKAKIKSL